MTDTATIRRDVDGLMGYLAFPCQPRAATFRLTVCGVVGFGPTDFRLEALLRFSDSEWRPLVTLLESLAHRTGSVTIPAEQVEWFPEGVRDSLRHDGLGGLHEHVLHGEVYDASAFARPPLMSGQIVTIERGPHAYLRMLTT